MTAAVAFDELAARRRRRCAALRMEPLAGCKHRDPDDPRHRRPPRPAPSTFGLDRADLIREANRLHRAGWPVDEVLLVLDVDAP